MTPTLILVKWQKTTYDGHLAERRNTALFSLNDEQLRALRGRYVQDVKKISGSISLDDAVRYQRGSTTNFIKHLCELVFTLGGSIYCSLQR